MQTKTTIRSTTKRTQNLGLTVTKATIQARRIVDKVMPGAMATVDSRTSWDAEADVQVIITTITFPKGHQARHALGQVVADMPLRCRPLAVGDSSIVITRTVK